MATQREALQWRLNGLDQQLDRLAEQAAEIAGRLASLPEIPEDDFLEGDVLMIEAWFTNQRHGDPYTYAAVKAGGEWYCTGRNFRGPVSWEALMDTFLSRPYREVKVFRATEWEEAVLA